MQRPSVTVIILTFNEARNIEAALDSVRGWAEAVFVVDSFSSDATVDLVRARSGDGVGLVQHAFVDYAAQWNWALTHLPIRTGWVLKLDADERATDRFRDEVGRRIAGAPPGLSGFVVHWRLIFMGRWLKWGALYPNGNLRLWRHGRARFEERQVNEHALVEGEVQSIASPIDHHDRKGLGAWIDRHNRYSAMEARALAERNLTGEVRPRLLGGTPDQRRMWLRSLYYRIPARALCYFLYRYVVRLGFLDGRAGFRFTFLHAAFLYWIDLKLLECRATGELPEIVWPPRGAAHPAVVASDLQRRVDTVRTAGEVRA